MISNVCTCYFFLMVNQKNSRELIKNELFFSFRKWMNAASSTSWKFSRLTLPCREWKVIKCEAALRGREHKFGFSAAFWLGQKCSWSAASGKDRGSRTLLSRLIWAVRMFGLVPFGNTASPKRCGRADCKRANKVYLAKASEKIKKNA